MVEWRDIPGHERRYQISSEGQVRSLPRNSATRQIKGRTLETSNGQAILSRGGKPTRYRVRDLMAEVFPELTPEDEHEWRDVPGYEGLYQINEAKQVRRVNTGRILKTSPIGTVGLSKPGAKLKAMRVDDIMADTFGGEGFQRKHHHTPREKHYIAPGKTREDMIPFRKSVNALISRTGTARARRNREKLVKLYYEYRGMYNLKEFKMARDGLI